MDEATKAPSNFIYDFIEADLAAGVNTRVQTRFPPEPNGYLHIGHAKAISISYVAAQKYGGEFNLRLDDTNPSKEEVEYVDAIQADMLWLGFPWKECYYASSYFDFLHECAFKLIEKGLAYVCDLTAEEVRTYRGTLTEPGQNSPYRERRIDENRDLFTRMTAGEFPDGARTLRAKIDMRSPNLNMRDPVIYRIAHVPHHRTGDTWCVYPMYDFAHPLSDAAENVTYSLCSLEFENHRPLYDWFLQAIGFAEPPRQIEFARLNLNYCLTSKRKCLHLVNTGVVRGWDDPRMATLCGMRRRGYPPEAILDFVEKVGVAKAYSVVDFGLLESCVRDRLGATAPRAMAVLRPLRVIIENYPEGKTEEIEIERHPDHPEWGTQKVRFSREIFVEQDDFLMEAPKKYFRLYPGNEVRLKGAYYIRCTGYETDATGAVTLLRCTYDPESYGGTSPDGRKVRGTLHWVEATTALHAEVRLYDRLFTTENPSVDDYLKYINPKSLEILQNCKIDPAVLAELTKNPAATAAQPTSSPQAQFIRLGYFCLDADSTPEQPVFNRVVALNSSWSPPAAG
ncbi:MAG: glutamine--tRNA ligase/YqeY domain fusion protein [Oscillospiraceae bacterium]|jgi:glutaminyl-tRNA synthetase|nr:glutamine--tRNA ligase/YqeY domain fusion protein [Oscillospiraceae bacterium]